MPSSFVRRMFISVGLSVIVIRVFPDIPAFFVDMCRPAISPMHQECQRCLSVCHLFIRIHVLSVVIQDSLGLWIGYPAYSGCKRGEVSSCRSVLKASWYSTKSRAYCKHSLRHRPVVTLLAPQFILQCVWRRVYVKIIRWRFHPSVCAGMNNPQRKDPNWLINQLLIRKDGLKGLTVGGIKWKECF